MPKKMINGVNLHYHVYGKGVPILFIHPPLLTSENFNYQAAQLSAHFKVITFDIRGHGLSDVSKEPITYPLIVRDMLQLMDKLGIDKAYVCGYSTGGTIALHALLSYPDRFQGGILVSTMSEASDYWLRWRIALAIALTNVKAKNLLAWAITRGNADSRETYDNLKRTAKLGRTDNWRQYYRCSLTYNCTSQLKKIKAPIMLIYGKKDLGFFRYAGKLQRNLPHYQLFWIKGAKHQIPTKNALEMNELIQQWIRRQENEVKPEEKQSDIEPYIAAKVLEDSPESMHYPLE
ncbi:alpha/beta fold hydrolase [Paenibacillus apiarius]|uniref:Alpha/beta hydrolase n=1 Tax=Paenibacillus apiarius TaxID=46240 RepID=A0ABT4DW31_9BACL|nr:alpha/beta hydrolase [Paenibacillus apiarius]MBN3526671.1 alpha/beta hydrolase [Paenibacillus apiarius]MCY9513088.1 alpha/beta hydrolase [Paenibacillus apiarius]MCY9521554.1 alpha/beta hydrolase [Paenibacillus apiarius]MCY9551708.1 alpha/beta hydrolase [Paenibacillus apiarius]MCY9560504.1 alpha/beta hydrolase [Paenibacillus apiarius]